MNWHKLIPEEARAPQLKSGKVSIEFVILSDGRVAGMKIVDGSGSVSMDRAAWGGITASSPFAPLPAEFKGPFLALRFHFYYNPKKPESETPMLPFAARSSATQRESILGRTYRAYCKRYV